MQVGVQGCEGCGACLYGEDFREAGEAEADEGTLMAAGGFGSAVVKGCGCLRAMYDWAEVHSETCRLTVGGAQSQSR